MKIKKRAGYLVNVDFNKIRDRIKKQSKNLKVDYDKVSKKVIQGLYDGVTTVELDNLSSETAAAMTAKHPDYSYLAARIAITSLYKQTSGSFSESIEKLYKKTSLIDKELYHFVIENRAIIDRKIDGDRDLIFDYFGFKTLERAYLLKLDSKIVERPQYMWMRVALGISNFDLDFAFKTYDLMSKGYYTHATPTLFNAGTPKPQMSSCFLIGNKGDNLEGIMDTAKDVAKISSMAGGIGMHIHEVRANGSAIKGSGGKSNGLLPLFKTYNELARWWDQGGGKRKGSFAFYLEPWHDDLDVFLDLRKNHGKEELRARDLFTALWMPDLFMKRLVKSIESKEPVMWTTFCPNEIYQSTGKRLSDFYGKEFDEFYEDCEQNGLGRRSIPVLDIWNKICVSQMETGTPYIGYKDRINERSNQKNVGVIKSSNLCFTGDTIIAMADGSEKAKISDLASRSNKCFEVYSARNRRGGKIGYKTEIKRAKAFSTGFNEVVEITLSDGTKFKCTKDHKLFTVDNREVLANDSVGEILEPFWSTTDYKYKYIKSFTNGHVKQHKMIYDFHNNTVVENGFHVDHIEGNCDNINNLQLLSKEDHLKKTSEGMKGKNNSVYRLRDKEIYDANKKISAQATNNSNYSGINNASLIELGRKLKSELKIDNFNTKHYKILINKYGVPKSFSEYRFNGSFTEYFKYVNNDKLIYNESYEVDKKLINYPKTDYELWNDYLKENVVDGLKVLKVENAGKEETFDLTVEDNHNFYIITKIDDIEGRRCSGVLVHNCIEIVEYSDDKEQAVCNLASLCLPKFISNGKFNFEKLNKVVSHATIALNNVIDLNYYPTPETKLSNMRHRPIAIGVQGLADVFEILNMDFDSDEARNLNRLIFENIYHSSLQSSNEIAKESGAYETFKGSPLSEGKFQFNLSNYDGELTLDWETLRKNIVESGVKNSLLVALMPTASTSQIFGNNECFEPINSNIYLRRTLAGEFPVINKHLVRDLEALDLWNDDMSNSIILHKGSIQGIDKIPVEIRSKYRTVYEISQKNIINLSADRQHFIDQTQSMNLFMSNPTVSKITSMQVYAWKSGLKTGQYYLRSKAAVDAIQFTVNKEEVGKSCSIDNPDCESCGS